MKSLIRQFVYPVDAFAEVFHLREKHSLFGPAQLLLHHIGP